MEIRQVGEGAYFVPSYSEQTITAFQPTITNQTVTVKEVDEDNTYLPEGSEDNFIREDFVKVLKEVNPKVKK